MEGGLEGPADAQVPAVIPAQDSLIGDLLSMDIGAPTPVGTSTVPSTQTQPAFGGSSALDLLGGGLDSLVSVFK
jgi:AP-1 complex subunit beta-1